VRVRRSMYLYSGTKAGLDRLCDGLADSLEGTGVSLHLVRPGVVRSRMTQGQLERVPFTTGVNEVAENVMRGSPRVTGSSGARRCFVTCSRSCVTCPRRYGERSWTAG